MNTEENIQKYLDGSFSSEKLTSEIDNENSVFYFTEFKSKIIGYLKIHFGNAQTELNKTLEIERIYIFKGISR